MGSSFWSPLHSYQPHFSLRVGPVPLAVLPAFPLQGKVSPLPHHQPTLVEGVVVPSACLAAVRVQHCYWVVCPSLVGWILLLAAPERLK